VTPPWDELERIIRRDPGGRGVCSYLDGGRPLGFGRLRAAAEDLALTAKAVAIVTGFCIVDADPAAAETDGPPGALFLARALDAVGVRVVLVSDAYGLPLLEAGRKALRLDRVELRQMPLTDERAAESWTNEFWNTGLGSDLGGDLTHLIAIERAGPSHTLASLGDQNTDDEMLARFEREVPQEHRGVCHNMRGLDITSVNAPTHLLFESATGRRQQVRTIGIGDGGNEIGMGSFPWRTLVEAIARGPAALLPCRIGTDHAIVAGVSNWGAYALALAVCRIRDAPGAANWAARDEGQLIEALVRDGGAVDGVTKRREATVDGLPLEEYLQVLRDLRAAIGFSP
jgi:hypothetical protein